jgi:hypothetical protein
MAMNWTTAASLVLRPVFLLGLLWTAVLIGVAIRRRIPEGRVKRVLEHPAPLVPRTEAERRDWWPFIAWLAAAAIIWVPLILWANHH